MQSGNIAYARYGADEIARLKNLWIELNRYHIPIVTTFRERFLHVNFEAHLEFLSSHEETFAYVATANNMIIGFIIVIRDADKAEIDSIYVVPPYRHKGIGDQLMKKALREITNRCSEIVLKVAEGNEQPFHYKNHFKKRYIAFQYDRYDE